MIERRFVLDTNVIISAGLLPHSIAGQTLGAAANRGRILLSSTIADELERVLRRKKFERYAPEEKRLRFLASLLQEAELVDVASTIAACRDRDDDKFLELAIDGHADCIISGDADLLVLHPFRGIPILTPRSFLAWPNPDAPATPTPAEGE